MGLFRSTIDRVRRGLARTAGSLGGGLRSVLAGRPLDEDLIEEIEAMLIGADVGVEATAAIVDDLRADWKAGRISTGEEVLDHLKSSLKNRWEDVDRRIAVAPEAPTVILVVGVNGVGKTTSVAKIAHSLREEGRSVLLAAADTFRAGAVAQLSIWSERLGVSIVKGAQGSDPASVAYDAADAALARKVDVLLVDTAGRLHNQGDLMRQLVKIRDVIRKKIPGAPHEVLLVLDATSGQNGLVQARSFEEAVDITGVFLSKLDGTARGGIVVAIRDQLSVPVKLVGVGERPEDVEPFDPATFIDAIFE
ncbi:MAG: signal recognition particle-docking protein FtsY [Planctomycetota bacterium]|nr:signal recognition particle-docking protein FtsY [Planctomycetota bacterium]MEC8558534.1 signal recognition particle-docking protein FtsY [Planctomycetota bacterium]MEC9233027.1 signal recognition particle-docking protein FtsY [Planctomycetota bacterium]MED5506527.1 signal recognition particle-docking protein FtsY [Planctomycetota bacterium]